MVFVDATVAETMPAYGSALTAVAFSSMGLVARLGGSSLLMKSVTLSPEISAEDQAAMKRDYACARAMSAGRREGIRIAQALPLIRRLQAAGTPPVPTVCVLGGRLDRNKKLRPTLIKTSTDLMAAAAQGRVVIVDDAGHLIPQERPAPVVEAVLDVVGASS
jgi:pimeloyl-ACP methyl ester carboxylesterase